jgi:hypothetical protein
LACLVGERSHSGDARGSVVSPVAALLARDRRPGEARPRQDREHNERSAASEQTSDSKAAQTGADHGDAREASSERLAHAAHATARPRSARRARSWPSSSSCDGTPTSSAPRATPANQTMSLVGRVSTSGCAATNPRDAIAASALPAMQSRTLAAPKATRPREDVLTCVPRMLDFMVPTCSLKGPGSDSRWLFWPLGLGGSGLRGSLRGVRHTG